MKSLTIKKILVPIDFSNTSMKACDYAVTMAKLNNAEIALLHVVENNFTTPSPLGFDYSTLFKEITDYEKSILTKSDELLYKVAEGIKKKGVLTVNVITAIGRTHKQIVDISKTSAFDIIVMGTHGASGFREFLMGSNAFRVVNDAECPVLTVREPSKTPVFKKILVPFRDKAHSREKINPAIAMSKIYNSTIYLLGIDPEQSETNVKFMELEAKQSKAIIEEHGIACKMEVISDEYNSTTVLKYARSKEIDLIFIMSDIDKMSFSEFIMGPYAQQLVNHSPIPILSIRPAFIPELAETESYESKLDTVNLWT